MKRNSARAVGTYDHMSDTECCILSTMATTRLSGSKCRNCRHRIARLFLKAAARSCRPWCPNELPCFWWRCLCVAAWPATSSQRSLSSVLLRYCWAKAFKSGRPDMPNEQRRTNALQLPPPFVPLRGFRGVGPRLLICTCRPKGASKAPKRLTHQRSQDRCRTVR